MKDETEDKFREIVQKYIDDLKALQAKIGNAKISVATFYGGSTLSEEIKLAEGKLKELSCTK